LALPSESPPLALDDEFPAEKATVGDQGIDVEECNSVSRQVPANSLQGRVQFLAREEIVDRVAYGPNQIESTKSGKLAHVSDQQRSVVADLRAGDIDHRRRNVATGYLPASLEHWQEAEAGTTGEVQQSLSAYPLLFRFLQQNAGPALVAVAVGLVEVVISWRKGLVGFPRPVTGEPARLHLFLLFQRRLPELFRVRGAADSSPAFLVAMNSSVDFRISTPIRSSPRVEWKLLGALH
jgi:hypothetical protein